ncbi:MAG: serine--tRNA ligase, partial [Candidatus Hydrogenedentes bacterium]|nr:serine--tRNA ligase [Candidatus Hydrogenedentota bacterium]
MFDIRLLRANPEAVKAAMKRRHAKVDIDAILDIDAQRRTAIYEVEQLRAQQNKAGESIAASKRAGDNADVAIAEMKSIKGKISSLEDQVRQLDTTLQTILLTLPNIPDESVPDGSDETANKVERTYGTPPVLDFEAKDHVDIAEDLGIVDFSCAAKLAGARFTLSRGPGALLERALINFMLDIHT